MSRAIRPSFDSDESSSNHDAFTRALDRDEQIEPTCRALKARLIADDQNERLALTTAAFTKPVGQ